jgi:hypothetical protein
MSVHPYCSPRVMGRGSNNYLPRCSFESANNGFNSHIRGQDSGPYKSSVFPGTRANVGQYGNESGANGPIWIFNDGVGPAVELKRRYDNRGGYGIYNR